jgi:eukaryotic-like serine/threonine-protein kinase
MAALTEIEIEGLRTLAEAFLHVTGRTAVLNNALGAGASAAVFEMIDGIERRALKVYLPAFFSGEGGPAEMRRIKLQEELIGHTCPNLVQILRVSLHGKTCFVEMEHVGGVDLNEALGVIPRAEIPPLICQLVTAVRYLEELELAHRDIKPHNIRVSNDFKNLKLLDLGVVRKLDYDSGPDATAQGPKKPFIATAQYSSPEYLFWLHPPSKELWHALSIYQVGAVLHDLIMRRLLFADEVATENRYALAMAVLQRVPATSADDVPTWLCALASRCLTKDMARRLHMVSWDDFRGSPDKVAAAVRRFQQVRATGIRVIEDGISQHDRDLRRSNLMASVGEQLLTRIQATLDGCQLERIHNQDAFALILRVPNTSLRIDFLVDFRWSEIAKEDTAAVYTYGRVRPDSIPYSHHNAAHDTCTVANGSIDTTVDVLLSRFVEQVGVALEIAQIKSGEISEVISLETLTS